ncbi:type II toxin-antitoxin system VapC family toxin [Pseudothauera nasutitermitis]|uniref:Type II toxin-antitoxin system VapC family toxin n=1 Tax=Pseudothauera nasutitermitis TaxID=2565930 RepID=A0A4S4AVE4_9RHOO|nr:type II toxin-antitoxin system VapC family toxin [Pseudothauera nasutitermitis]THF63997.1 type II toxin-antitoxin system VapC family toxin [Pseudothauera nasutitermitis]
MNLLLDTHALLWWFTDDPRLSAGARRAIADESNTVFVSAASAWEIATKHRLGKLNEAIEAIDRFGELVAADGFEHLPVTYLHALKAGSYQVDHRDPFDRVLAAQSALDGLTLVTIDPAFKRFGTEVVW